MDDFKPKSAEIYNFFYPATTEINETLLYEAQKQDPVIRQLLFWKRYENFSHIPSLTIHANKGLLHNYRCFSNLSINEKKTIFCTMYKNHSHQKFAYHSLSY